MDLQNIDKDGKSEISFTLENNKYNNIYKKKYKAIVIANKIKKDFKISLFENNNKNTTYVINNDYNIIVKIHIN